MKIFDIITLIFICAVVQANGALRDSEKHQKKSGNSSHRVTHSQESETVIENKNVNIVVNVDPKEVAKELWSIIEERMEKPPSRRSPSTKEIISELESIITPIVKPSRRFQPSAYEIAIALDHVTRKVLKTDASSVNSIENEIITRNTVADMMKTLKQVQLAEKKPLNSSSELINDLVETRRNFGEFDDDKNDYDNFYDNQSDHDNDNDSDYIQLLVKVRKMVILRALKQQNNYSNKN